MRWRKRLLRRYRHHRAGVKLIEERARSASPGLTTPWFSPATLGVVLFVLFIFAFTVIYIFRPVGPRTTFDLKTFATLPISHEGRIQPLD